MNFPKLLIIIALFMISWRIGQVNDTLKEIRDVAVYKSVQMK